MWEALDELVGYLRAREGCYLPDYAARQQYGLWIASCCYLPDTSSRSPSRLAGTTPAVYLGANGSW